MAALVERVGGRAGAREMLGGAAPGMAGLPAAMQQQHRLAGVAIDVGDEPVAGGTGEHRGCGLQMLHGRLFRNSSTPALNTRSPTATMWSRFGNVERLAVRKQRREPGRRSGDVVLGAGRDQHRRLHARQLLAPQRLARAAQAGGKRAQIGSGLFGEQAERLALRVGHVVDRGQFERARHVMVQARDFDQLDADAAQDDRAHPLGMPRRHDRADAPAERIAHHVGAFEAEMGDQRRDVAGHQVGVVVGRIVQLGRLAVAAIVERDDAAIVARQRRDPAGLHPVHLRVRGKAVHQHDRLARALVEIGDLDVSVPESRHD